MLIINTQPVS